jgi:hypothetical protein
VGEWDNKYNFQDLSIGESKEVTGIEGNIRSSATMWGTRYGIWLQCEKIDDGRIKVTRVPEPISWNKKERIDKLEHKVDSLAGLMFRVLDELKKQKE